MLPKSTPQFLIATLCIFALTGIARAQMDAGFVGKRYVGASLFNENLHHENINDGHGAELCANVPLASFLDVGVKTSYEKFSGSWQNFGNYSISDRRITGSVIGYYDTDYFKPFIELSYTNTAQSSTFAGATNKNSEGLWGTGIGIEAPVTKSTAIFGLATYNRYFNNNYDNYWTYKFGINTWFTRNVGGVASVSFWDGESTTVSLGIIYRF
jgi:hypothetical protein